jgi:glyoxylase-like metal-dependent hydrolase (beta-lactamase superfamily II)
MKRFERITENIYRITTPYKDIFTTVYLLIAKNGAILFDTASFDEDVDEVLVPALEQMGITAEKLKYVFISHSHKDHAGGLARFVTHYPEATIVSRSPVLREKYEGHPFLFPEEGTILLDTYRVIPIVGHTQDSAALLDTRTNTLITGDCLQLWGICGSEDWASNINFPTEHWQALNKLEKMPMAAIYTAHDYYPMGHCAVGAQEISRYIEACREPLLRIKELIVANPEADDAAVRALYNAQEGIPTIREAVVRAVRKSISAGEF